MDGNGMLTLVYLLLLAAIIFIVRAFRKRKKDEHINDSFSDTHFITSKKIEYGNSTLYVDDINKKWAVKTRRKPPMFYNYSDLIEYEVFQDGNSIAKGNAGNALIGGLLFGVTGAIIGASSKRAVKNTCRTLQLRIRVNNLHDPEVVLDFIKSEVRKDTRIYKNAFEASKNMAATLTYIQKQTVNAEK